MILSLYAEEMSERGREGRKKIFPAGTARALGGLACPSRISFSASCAFRKHVSSPRPGNQPFFRPCTSRSTAWPGNQPFFRPNTSRRTARPGNRPFFWPYPSQMAFSLDGCWFCVLSGRAGFGSAGWGMAIRASVHAGEGGQNITKGGVFLH